MISQCQSCSYNASTLFAVKAVKASNEVTKKTLQAKNNFIHGHIEKSAGPSKNAIMTQTSTLLLKSFEEKARFKILKIAQIPQTELTAAALVAMKADMGIPWEKLKRMPR